MAVMVVFEVIAVALEAASLYMSMTNKPEIGGPRLSDIRVTASTYGSPIREGWGVFRAAGNIIYSSVLIEHPQNGKGMGGPIQYQYTWTGAVALTGTDGTGPIGDILRIWADTKLVFDKTGETNGGLSQYGLPQNSGKGGGESTYSGQGPGGSWYNNVGTFRVYTGTQDQMPDPAMEALFGADNCNANRGQSYVVFDNINLINYGNRVPNFTFEIAASGTSQNQLSQKVTWNASDTEVGTVGTESCVIDSLRQRAYFFCTADDGTEGIKVVDLLTRKEIAWADYEQLFGSNPDRLIADGPAFAGCVGTDGYLYISCFSGGNSSPIVKIDPEALIEVGHFGATGSSLEDGPDGFVTTQTMIPITVSGVNYVACMAYAFNHMQLGVLEVDSMTYATSGTFEMTDPIISMVGAQQLTLSSASLFALGSPDYGAAQSTPISVYQIIISYGDTGQLEVTTNSVAAIAPGDIDSEWTVFNGIAGPILDQTDNNLLVFIQDTSDTLTSGHAPRYLVKINSATGDVMWKTYTNNPGHFFGTINNIPNGLNFSQNSITLGNLAFIDSVPGAADQVLVVDTQEGAIQSQRWAGLSVGGSQLYADTVGAILFYGSLTDVMTDQWGAILVNAAEANAVPLATVVANICSKVGFGPTDIDVSLLSGDDVLGYVLEGQMNASDALKPLLMVYTMDSVESDNVLRFVPRGGASIATIPASDFAYMDKKLNALVTETRQQEVDLPNQMSIGFLDPERDFTKSVQYFRRPSNPYPVMFSKNPRTEEVPMVMEAVTAKNLAEMILYMQWVNRVSFKSKLPWRYLVYDPADVLTLTLSDDTTVASRTVQMTMGADMTIEMGSVSESAEVYNPNAGAFGGSFPQNLLIPSSATKMFLFDVPLLRDVDDLGQSLTPMYYALGAYTPSWIGGGLFTSPTDQNFQLVGTVNLPGVPWGVCVNALGDTDKPFAVDKVNTLTVAMAQGGDNLASTTLVGMCNGANAAAILNAETGVVEIIQFQTVTQNPDGTYTLSNLARGRRGSETMRGAHVVGENFVLLTATGLATLNLSLSAKGSPMYYEAITQGASPESGHPVTFTDTMRTLMPYAPVHLQAVTSGSDIAISWYRRTRVAGAVASNGGTDIEPLSETTEGYSVDIYDAMGETVLRTIDINFGATPTTDPGVTYTDAEYTADFGSKPASINVMVYQVSGAVGRGFSQMYDLIVDDTRRTP